MAKLISKTYGDALFEVALDKGITSSLLSEVEAVREILDKNPDFDKLMEHPCIPREDKLKAIDEVFKGRVSDVLCGFLSTLAEKDRYSSVRAIFDYFTAKVKEYEKTGIAYVTTAVKLNDKQKKAVSDRLLETTSYKKMEMHYDVDASLIGGMKIRIGDRVVDSSIKNKIEDLTRKLLQIQLNQ